MLNLLQVALTSCIIALSPAGSLNGFSEKEALRHEVGHCNCWNWKHDESDPKTIIPPKACDHPFKGELTVLRFDEGTVRKMCRGGRACALDLH